MAVFPISGDVLVVRIPELPEELTLANEDKVPIWHASTNVTESVSLATLRSFIETGSGGTLDPIYSGGSILYIVPPSAEGLDQFVYAPIAGFDFKLRRDGYPMEPVTEFLRLDAGGFKLIGTTLVEGQRYELDIFELYNGAIPPPSGISNSSGFIVGNKIVNTNESISVNDLNKVLQVRGASNALTLTLPDVGLCPDNSFVIIETLITNTKQHKINTTSGQYIYLNNQAKTEEYIGIGEYVWLYRTDDGWYLIADKGNFSNLGVPIAAYKAALNQVECAGQLLTRTIYPRLWAFVQTLGASLVSDATWSTASVSQAGRMVAFPYRGCFSTGDGTTTFRMPDFRGMSVRGLLNAGGVDPERNFNSPGGYQRHEFAAHNHDLSELVGNSYSGGPNSTRRGNGAANPETLGRTTTNSGGTESRMDNIGLLWFMNF